MTMDRETMPLDEYKQMLENWGNDFTDGKLFEAEYRARLNRTGMTATEIEDEIEKYHP